MKLLKFKDKTIELFTDPMEFANSKHKPFGELPENGTFCGVFDNETGTVSMTDSTGFTLLNDNLLVLYVPKNCPFEDILSTVSHELGHLVTNGFKKNPPDKKRYDAKHEQKANHYETFVLDSYKLATIISNNLTS